jgi:hypothetical protein
MSTRPKTAVRPAREPAEGAIAIPIARADSGPADPPPATASDRERRIATFVAYLVAEPEMPCGGSCAGGLTRAETERDAQRPSAHPLRDTEEVQPSTTVRLLREQGLHARMFGL